MSERQGGGEGADAGSRWQGKQGWEMLRRQAGRMSSGPGAQEISMRLVMRQGSFELRQNTRSLLL